MIFEASEFNFLDRSTTLPRRYTDTEKWRKPWFRKLPPKVKLFWIYLLDSCTHYAVWDADFELASFCIGDELSEGECLEALSGRVHVFDDGRKWFIPNFIEFQYGSLNPANKPHKSVLEHLTHLRPLLGSKVDHVRGIHEPKDKAKAKDQAKDNRGGEGGGWIDSFSGTVEQANLFAEFRKRYPGTKRGAVAELEHFVKKHRKNWKDVLPMLTPGLEREIEWRKNTEAKGGFVPPWKHLKTWINNSCWDQEFSTEDEGAKSLSARNAAAIRRNLGSA